MQNAITGTAIYYGDGGGGGHNSNEAAPTTGGSGRGGAGTPRGNGGDGEANSGSGGGGGGASFGQGGNGGSGIVVIRYAGDATGITGGSTNTAIAAGEAITTFTTSGTFTIDFATRPGVTLTSPVTGTGDFTFAGPGRLTLAAANTFTGTARIGDGTLSLGDVAALQNATLDMNAADAGTAAFAVAGNNTYALAGLTGSRTLALGGNSLSIGGTGATSDYAGVLSGTGGLTKAGAGQLTLSGANLYTGATAIDAGTLKLSSTNASTSYAIASGAALEIAVATGPTTFTGGTYTGSGTLRKTGPGRIRWSGATDFALDASATIDVQEGALQASTSANQPWANNQASLNVAAGALFDVDAAAAQVGGLTGSGTVVLGLAPAGTFPLQKLTVGVADATSEFAGVIQNGTGTAPLEKIGTGTITLTGGNTYTGTTTISAGTLAVGNGGTTGTLGGGAVVNNATLEFNRSNDLTAANVISGTGTVIKNGVGVTTLSGANTFSGGTTISAGTLAVAAIADSGTSNLGPSGTLALAGGTLEYTAAGNATTARLVDISAANTTSAISVSDAAATLTLTNNVRNSDPTHPNVVLTKTGSGTLEIAGAGGNTGTSLVAAAGTTLLNATARAVYEIRALDTGATVRLAQANQVFNGDAISTTGNIRMTGGTLDLDGNAQEIFRLIGSGNAIAGTGTITSSTAATFTVGNNLAGRPSLFDGSLTGSLALVTRGTNPITLGGASSYTGTTTVGGSRLSVNGSLGNTAVTVTAGILGGSGSIAGSVTVQSGGTLAPGNSIASFATGATTFASGATFGYEVDSSDLGSLGTAADLLVVDGNLSITAGSLLSFADLNQTPQPFVEDSTVFAMINYTGTWDGGQFTYGGQPLADGSRFTVGSQMWEIDYDYAYNGSNTQPLNFSGDFLPVSGTQTFVTITAVPEPATLALLGIAGLGIAAARYAGRFRIRRCSASGTTVR